MTQYHTIWVTVAVEQDQEDEGGDLHDQKDIYTSEPIPWARPGCSQTKALKMARDLVAKLEAEGEQQ